MEQEAEIDIKEIFQLLRTRWRFITFITIVAMIISGVISFFVLQPVYESSATMLVGQSQAENTQVNSQDVLLSRQLVATYGEIMKTSTILEQVIRNENLDMSVKDLAAKITVMPVGDTEIIKIKVTDRYPLTAANIANEVSRVFQLKIQDIMRVDNISIIEEATPANNPIKPNKMMNIAIAAILGLMGSIFIIFIRSYLDNTLKTPEDILRHLELPVLGSIPQNQE